MERYTYVTNPISKKELEDSIYVGILTTEKDIMDYMYLISAKSFRDTKGTMNLPHRKDIEYSDSIWEGLSVEDYCKKYPINFDSETGVWSNK